MHALKITGHSPCPSVVREALRLVQKTEVDAFWGFLLCSSPSTSKLTYRQIHEALRNYQVPACLLAPPCSDVWVTCEELCSTINIQLHRIYGYRRNDLFRVFRRFASADEDCVSIDRTIFRHACCSELKLRHCPPAAVDALFALVGENSVGVSLYDLSCFLKHKFDVDANKRELSCLVQQQLHDVEKEQEKLRKLSKSKHIKQKSVQSVQVSSLRQSDEEVCLVDRLLLASGSALIQHHGLADKEKEDESKFPSNVPESPPLMKLKKSRGEVVIQHEVNVDGIYKNLNLSIRENGLILDEMFNRSIQRLQGIY